MTGEELAWRLYEGLVGLGYDFFTGVPCSLLGALYTVLDEARAPYYPATREDLALGLAGGAALAGRRPAVLMQNSGLGVSINALLSLQRMYALPVLLIVSWRGFGADAPEHLETGRQMTTLLKAVGIRFGFTAEPEALSPNLHGSGPVALLVKPNELECSR